MWLSEDVGRGMDILQTIKSWPSFNIELSSSSPQRNYDRAKALAMKIGAEWLHRGSDRCALAKQFSTWAIMIAIFCTSWSGLSKSLFLFGLLLWLILHIWPLHCGIGFFSYNTNGLARTQFAISLYGDYCKEYCLAHTLSELIVKYTMYVSTIYRFSCACTEAHKR